MENYNNENLNNEEQTSTENRKAKKAKKERRRMKPAIKWTLIGIGAGTVALVGYEIIKTIVTKKAPTATEVKAVEKTIEKAAEVAAVV